MLSLAEISQKLATAIGNLTYAQAEELKNDLVARLDSSLAAEKEEISGLITKADEALKEIEHQIWVQSRECTPAAAEKLVPQIPDNIILNLSKSPQHEGRPRLLLQTPAFQARLSVIQNQSN